MLGETFLKQEPSVEISQGPLSAKQMRNGIKSFRCVPMLLENWL